MPECESIFDRIQKIDKQWLYYYILYWIVSSIILYIMYKYTRK